MRAFVAMEDEWGWKVVGVDSDVRGYRDLKSRISFISQGAATRDADRRNRELGIKPIQARAAAIASMGEMTYEQAMEGLSD